MLTFMRPKEAAKPASDFIVIRLVAEDTYIGVCVMHGNT